MICLLLGANAASAATFDDPDWPCIQRKMPNLSIGQMWSGIPPEGDWRDDPEIAQLATTLSVRRTSLEEVKLLADDFAAATPAEARPARMALLFSGIIDQIDAERGEVISGIGRYAHKQANLAAQIKKKEADLVALNAANPPDMDKIEELEDSLNWDIRIFRERAQSLTYVCETPVLLEQRAFAIARIQAGDS